MTPENFPILLAHAQSQARTIAAIDEMAAGVTAGAIRNAALVDIKFQLGRDVDHAWKQHVSEPFFYAGKWEGQTEDVRKVYDSIMILSLHDVLATARKLEKSRAQGPAMEAMRSYVAEILPLAKAAASLKDKVIKGRAPRGEPVNPVNPNKVVKTCPCCFRKIAVVRERMALHGYERPGHGYILGNCHGTRFPPLEVSPEGVIWMLDELVRPELSRKMNAYNGREALTSLSKPLYNKLGLPEFVQITKDSPEWEWRYKAYVTELVREIDWLKRDVAKLEKIIREWKPQP